jgi:hypothetical protein
LGLSDWLECDSHNASTFLLFAAPGDARRQTVKIIRVDGVAPDEADGIFPLVKLQGDMNDAVV